MWRGRSYGRSRSCGLARRGHGRSGPHLWGDRGRRCWMGRRCDGCRWCDMRRGGRSRWRRDMRGRGGSWGRRRDMRRRGRSGSWCRTWSRGGRLWRCRMWGSSRRSSRSLRRRALRRRLLLLASLALCLCHHDRSRLRMRWDAGQLRCRQRGRRQQQKTKLGHGGIPECFSNKTSDELICVRPDCGGVQISFGFYFVGPNSARHVFSSDIQYPISMS